MTNGALQTIQLLAARHGLGNDACRALWAYVAAVAGWRDANVTGLSDPDEIARTLVGDALSLLDLDEIADAGASPAGPWLDLGSGAGTPGIPLAVALPAVRMVLLDSIGKKCAFLTHALAETSLEERADVVCSRSEQYAAGPGRAAHERVLVRAVGPLATVVELAAPLLAPGGFLLVCTSLERAAGEGSQAAAAAGMCGLTMRRMSALTASPLRHSTAVLFESVSPPPPWLPRRAGLARRRPLGR